MMKIIFIRHGESETNVSNIKSCSLDKHSLTRKGRISTEKIRRRLKNTVIDFIYTSPILRTRETAEIINKEFKKRVIQDNLLREYNWGSWNERNRKNLINESKKYKLYAYLSLNKKFDYKFGEKGKGESRAEVVERIKKFLKKVIKKHSNKTVLIISHSGVNAAIHRILKKVTIKEYFKQEKLEFNAIQYFVLDKNGKLVNYKKVLT